MSHQIVKRGAKDYTCSVCNQHWTIPSKAHCPGLPVVPFSKRGTWMSQTELDHRGYRIKALPEPIACYRTAVDHSVVYVWLYDPVLCERKRESKRLKVLHYVDTLQWPTMWLDAFERAIEYRDLLDERAQRAIAHDPLNYRDPAWQLIVRDIAERASSLVFFAADELGETVTLSIPLSGVRRQWSENWHRQSDMHKLVSSLERAYKEHQWKTRPRLSDEQLQALEDKRIAHEREREAQESERRAKLFEFSRHLVPDTPLTPAIQRELFE
jgi:hypothetical protein